jgi:hypothetical protein
MAKTPLRLNGETTILELLSATGHFIRDRSGRGSPYFMELRKNGKPSGLGLLVEHGGARIISDVMGMQYADGGRVETVNEQKTLSSFFGEKTKPLVADIKANPGSEGAWRKLLDALVSALTSKPLVFREAIDPGVFMRAISESTGHPDGVRDTTLAIKTETPIEFGSALVSGRSFKGLTANARTAVRFLRPEGWAPDDKWHTCEPITIKLRENGEVLVGKGMKLAPVANIRELSGHERMLARRLSEEMLDTKTAKE